MFTLKVNIFLVTNDLVNIFTFQFFFDVFSETIRQHHACYLVRD